jgi:DNA polymerase
MTKKQRLDEVKQKILEAKLTPGLASTANQLVFGSGNVDAEVVFVGEAPGKKEDESGEPFVGAAGKFLDEMLSSVDIKREDTYITNIVKYRPPDNRDPLPEEKQAFWPYLLEQISIIKPKIIATLGRHSGQVFIPDLHISADHGQPKSIKVTVDGKDESILVLPLYHPAAALYNGGLRKTLLQDFQIVPKLLKEI